MHPDSSIISEHGDDLHIWGGGLWIGRLMHVVAGNR